MIRTSLAVALILCALPAWAQGNDGDWPARIQCTALPDTGGPLNQTFSMRIAAGRVIFERPILDGQGNGTGQFERGEGPVGADGQISITTRGQVGRTSFRGNFTGQVNGPTMRLTGPQAVSLGRNNVTVNRTCTITATRR